MIEYFDITLFGKKVKQKRTHIHLQTFITLRANNPTNYSLPFVSLSFLNTTQKLNWREDKEIWNLSKVKKNWKTTRLSEPLVITFKLH